MSAGSTLGSDTESIRFVVARGAALCPQCAERLQPPPDRECGDCGFPRFRAEHADFCRVGARPVAELQALLADVVQRHLFEVHEWSSWRLNRARFSIEAA